MRKKEKGKISLLAKLLLVAALILIAIIVLFNFFGFFQFEGFENLQWKYWVYVFGSLSIITLVVIFLVTIYYILVKRIMEISNAVQKVAHGDYGVTVSEKGNDELTALARNFNKMTKELQLNAMLSKEFVSYVSHEFKTPLSVIRTHAEALQSSEDEEERKAYSDVIIDETDGLTQLSRSILLVCKLDSTNLVPLEDNFMPSEQIRSLILSTQIQWSNKDIKFDIDNLEDFEIKSNSMLTYLVWQNLIGNAIKFTNKGGNITILLRKEGYNLHFAITDDGVGISDADKGKIFTLFFTGNKMRNKEGSGIGLYLTKLVVEKLGGQISFNSEYGHGSTFEVTLPL